MLSILIPERNFDCTKLVQKLANQCFEAEIDFEILVFDDASSLFLDNNRIIQNIPKCSFIEFNQNKGAARTRNTLVGMAKFPFVLMMDCDAEVPDDHYIERYLESIGKADVIIGGLIYSNEKPSQDRYLRWHYGINRECISPKLRNKDPYKSLMSFQFLTRKEVLINYPFEETVQDYGHEDTLLGFEFMKAGISILYIDNPLIHIGLDQNNIFIQKSLQATRKYLTHPVFQNDEIAESIKLFRTFKKVKKYNLVKVLSGLYLKSRDKMYRNLTGNNPSLFVFDLYRLGYLCLLDFLESKEKK